MVKNLMISGQKTRRSLGGALLWIAAVLVMFSSDVFAQDYEFTIEQRRKGDQIAAEIWVKASDGTAANLGNMTIAIEYDEDYLSNATLADGTNPSHTTDSVSYDLDQASPVVTITSPFSLGSLGFSTIQGLAKNDGNSLYIFELNTIAPIGATGYQPSDEGKGTFVGSLLFDIVDASALLEDTYTGIKFNSDEDFAPHVITDVDGNNLTASCTFTDPGDFAIRGIKLLNPNRLNQAVNRNPANALESLDPNDGYPVYFERSGLGDPNDDNYGTGAYGYVFEYSTDNGSTWTEFGRVAESVNDLASVTESEFKSGEIDIISASDDKFITQGDGSSALTLGYGGIIRVIWDSDEFFIARSEQALMRITQLEIETGTDLDDRDAFSEDITTRWDVSDETFVLGRLFFAQLDGSTEFFKSARNFSNATQLTVEAWVNLNTINGDGTEPAIVASSFGPTGPEEGAWMLYLSDGQFPAFRAREFEGRGTDGYIANLVAVDPLTTSSDAEPITDTHSENWAHIAATVSNGTVNLYVNGELVASETNDIAANIRMLTSNHPVWIGVNPNPAAGDDNFLHAGVKEVKVWRKALDQATLRSHVAGVYQPTTYSAGDERSTLELYYPLQATKDDEASVFFDQNSTTDINFYNDITAGASAVNTSISYRPDKAHIILTSPKGGEGVSNLEDETFEVRWVAYGLGSLVDDTDDLEILFSRDGGTSYYPAIDNSTPALPLDTLDIEAGTATWEPYNNISSSGQDDDLQGIETLDGNYNKKVILKIAGLEDNNQDDIYAVSDTFTVAPYFALKNDGNAIVKVPANTDLNLNTTSVSVIEAWIRPFRFPTEQEGSFPIISKVSETGELNYALRLLPTGQLQFAVASSTGDAERIATSSADIDSVIYEPGVLDPDSTWTHVAVYFNVNDNNDSEIIFYIDGTPQDLEGINDQLGSDITIDPLNEYPLYIGFEPNTSEEDGQAFVGEMKEVRIWNGEPGGQAAASDMTTSALTYFIQGAQSIRADELTTFNGQDYAENLVAAYMFDGGNFLANGIWNGVAAYPNDEDITAVITGTGYEYSATQPFIKVVEPTYLQGVRGDEDALRVRWVGFDYARNDTTTFRNGEDETNHADLEFSIRGGGDTETKPYQFVASQVYNSGYDNALTLTTGDAAYEFQGVSSNSQFAAKLDVSMTDPDENDDETYTDQAQMGAVNSNARLRLRGRQIINGYDLEYMSEDDSEGEMETLKSESKLFTITPESNFIVKVLLEGYHTGGTTDPIEVDLGNQQYFNDGSALTLDFYEDNAGEPGNYITSTYSTGYSDPDADKGDADFASVPFVLDTLGDGSYFVVVNHINHLPVMTRYAAPFAYDGDDEATTEFESGWDFSSWDGVSGELPESIAETLPIDFEEYYTAYGPISTDDDNSDYATTALIYNDGRTGLSTGPLPAMVAGDVFRDGAINALDRARVVADNGQNQPRSDVNGDGSVNTDDREIVYRNSGKESDPDLPVTTPETSINAPEEDNQVPLVRNMANVLPNNPELTIMFLNAEKEYDKNNANKGTKVKTTGSLLGGVDYKVTATPYLEDGTIFVPMYVENRGDEFALGNATFAILYDDDALKFSEMIQTENVIFSDQPGLGYFPAFTSPSEDAERPLPRTRTIDINFDSYSGANKPGQIVPNSPAYLGTLVFKVIDAKDAYFFDWSIITGVYEANGSEITKDGRFDPIQPIIVNRPVALIYPNGGEQMIAGRPYIITWTKPSQANSYAFIDFSADNGSSWTRVTDAPVNLANLEYNWTTPRVTSNECLIALVNAGTGTIIDKSDIPFEITAPTAEITRPASTDPIYKSNTVDYIRWNLEDDVDVYFEYSENGVNGWQKVTPTIDARMKEVKWVIPASNTKSAKVRMINADSKEVLAITSPFRILQGALVLTSPRAGEQLKAGMQKAVRWNYDNVNIFDMQISYDGGTTWDDIQQDVKAATRNLNWLVTQINSQNAIIRAIYDNDPELEYSRTGAFIISGGTDVNDPAAYGYEFNAAVPNPFTEQTELTFTLPGDEAASLVVYNSKGHKVATLIDNQIMGAGAHKLMFNGKNLPSGMYFVRLKVAMFNLTKEVVLVK